MATPIPANEAMTTAWSVAAATGGRIARVAGEGRVAKGVTTDTRAIRGGEAFVALRGDRFDGHAYVAEAVQRGAVLVMVDETAKAGGVLEAAGAADVVVVDDTLVALGAMARAHLRSWRRARGDEARVVAITGSAGKTTTKELTAALLGAVAPTLATAGNLNNRIGAPAMAFVAQESQRFCVFEAGMSLPGEIAAIASIVEPDVAIVTNVSVAHAEGVGGTRSAVAREKGALYAALAPSGVAIVNADDSAAMGELARSAARRASTFGVAESAHYRIAERTPRPEGGSDLVLLRRLPRHEWPDRLELTFPLSGHVAAIDLAAALAAADAAVGEPLPLDTIRTALAGLGPMVGRGHLRRAADGTLVIDDSYNANPASMRAALASFAEIAGPGRRLVAILGEMKELGALAREEHDALGDAVADAGVDLLIGCGGLVEATLARAAQRGLRTISAATAREAATVAEQETRPGDAVLVKASRSVGAEQVVSTLLARAGEAKGDAPK